jgi:hypothetical protein
LALHGLVVVIHFKWPEVVRAKVQRLLTMHFAAKTAFQPIYEVRTLAQGCISHNIPADSSGSRFAILFHVEEKPTPGFNCRDEEKIRMESGCDNPYTPAEANAIFGHTVHLIFPANSGYSPEIGRELAPAFEQELRTGCCGVSGPVPRPLSIREPTILS